jgi:hypothetical protein
MIAFKVVSFILFLTFGLTLFITENTRSTTALLIGRESIFKTTLDNSLNIC